MTGQHSVQVPRRPRVVRTPLVQQSEEADCGAACLAMVLAWHGRHVPRQELQNVCGAGRDGLTAAALARVAGEYGLRASGKRLKLTGRRETDLTVLRGIALPAVILVRGNHFVVLEEVTSAGRVTTNDPAAGRSTVDLDEFRSTFSGVVLSLALTDRFRTGGRREKLRDECVGWLSGHLRVISIAVAAGLASTALSVAAALLVRTAVARVAGPGARGANLTAPAANLTAPAANLTVPLAGLAAVAIGVVAATWVQQRFLNRTLIALAAQRSHRLMRRMLALPGSFFQRRFVAGVAARAQIADTIATQLTGIVIPGLANAVAVLAVFAVMAVLAPVTALVAAAGAMLSAVFVRLAARQETGLQAQAMAEQFRRDGEAMAGLTMIETVKAEGGTAQMFDNWAESHARTIDLGQRTAAAKRRYAVIVPAIDSLVLLAVLVVGAAQIAAGRLALADLIALVTLLGAAQAGTGALGRSALDLGRLRSSFALLADIGAAVPEYRYTVAAPHHRSTIKLAGRVEISDVTFGYDINRPPLLRDVSVTVEPGQRVAIVGPSGSGKSTLAALLVGAARPWTGEIRFDGKALDDIPRSTQLRSLAYVSQQPLLLEGTVADNIAFGDLGIGEPAMRFALSAACLDRVIDQRGGLHQAWVHQDGRNFSGGERQRMVIARALARDPAVLVLDEATSALEGPLELQVDHNIRSTGATTIVIAHRLDTVRAADLVLVMAGGRVVQRGRHDELSIVDGPYRKLIGVPA
jgi:ABC-type bacteriocin/lantibiotic exporter with double-glycine peptidase domain